MRKNCSILTVAFLACLLSLASPAFAQNLEIHCIDVGQGDCTLIVSPSGQTMLFDAAKSSQADEIYSYLVNVAGLDSTEVIDYLVVSHYHADHIGGVVKLKQYGIDFGVAYDRGWTYCSATYNNYVAAISSVRSQIQPGQVIDLGAGVTATCVAVNGVVAPNDSIITPPYYPTGCLGSRNENDYSVALRIDFHDFQFFIGGDLSGQDMGSYHDIETFVGPVCGQVELYQVNHHASETSNNDSFLADIDPEVSVVSVGRNSYGLPDSLILDRLAQTSYVYQTETDRGLLLDGTIFCTTTGSGYDSFYCAASGSGNNAWYPITVGEVACLSVTTTNYTPIIRDNSPWLIWDLTVTNCGNVATPVHGELFPIMGDCAQTQIEYFDVHKQLVTMLFPGESFSGFYYYYFPIVDSVSLAALNVAVGPGYNDYIAEACFEFNIAYPFGRFDGSDRWGDFGVWGEREEDEVLPGVTALTQNYPNPFNAATSIGFDLAVGGNVSLRVYNLAGREIATLADEFMDPGRHTLAWDGAEYASGIYFYKLQTSNGSVTRRMTLLK